MKNIKTIKRYLQKVFNIKSDQEAEIETYEEVKCGISFKGTNLWVMAIAMLISCIGLNINSKAAVIGAMIMSPLMGPVFGIGFSLAISDARLLKLAIINLLRIVTICLTCSTLYYLLNPYHIPTEELISFSSPTLFDILLAFFGGLAGFIAITRRDGNRVLVGVAVATACIPPLCTAGYGIATMNLHYLIGGLYTYLLNCVFICIGSYLITRYLHFKTIKESNLQRIHLLFGVVALLMLVPAAFLAYKMAKKNIYITNAKTFIEQEISPNYHIIHEDINAESRTVTVDLFENASLKSNEIKWNNKLNEYGLLGSTLELNRSSNHEDDLISLKNEIEELRKELVQLKVAHLTK